jgi:hypothetical protein
VRVLDVANGGATRISWNSRFIAGTGVRIHLFEHNTRFLRDERGYASIQSTRPQTLAHALDDSPVGLCAWRVEKRRSWSDCGGDVERVFTRDELLTTVCLYWLTHSFGSSARFYYETAHHPWRPSHDRQPVVEAATGVARFPRDVIVMPRPGSSATTTCSATPRCRAAATSRRWRSRRCWSTSSAASSARCAADPRPRHDISTRLPIAAPGEARCCDRRCAGCTSRQLVRNRNAISCAPAPVAT